MSISRAQAGSVDQTSTEAVWVLLGNNNLNVMSFLALQRIVTLRLESKVIKLQIVSGARALTLLVVSSFLLFRPIGKVQWIDGLRLHRWIRQDRSDSARSRGFSTEEQEALL